MSRSLSSLVLRTAAIAAALTAAGSLFVAADARAEPAGVTLSLETDPATFVLGGFAAHVRARAAGAPRWSLGAGVYALDLPSPMVELAPGNRDEGWDARISVGAGLFLDRYLRDDGEGVFVGLQLGVQRFQVTRDERAGDARFVNVLVMPRVGYTWHPFDAGFYVMPWLGVGATARIAGEVEVAGERYDVFPVTAFATLHAGWQL